MSKRNAITPAVLRELLNYDPETGAFRWKERDVSWFQPSARRSAAHICALWNARYAGKPALTAKNQDGYRHGYILGVHVKAHQVAWAWVHGCWPENEIDHGDGDEANNRIRNLQDTTHQSNSLNRRAYQKASDLPPGVKFYPNRRVRPYQARIRIRGKSLSLGYHDTPEKAHAAYLDAAREHGFSPRHGRLNENLPTPVPTL